MTELTIRQAEQELAELGFVLRDRDNVVARARLAGVSKSRIAALTGLARSTVDAILERTATAA